MHSKLVALISRAVQWSTSRARSAKYDFFSRSGLNPFASISDLGPLTLDEARDSLCRNHLRVPNVSGFYHGILCDWFTKYGLGDKCLLISETRAVSEVFSQVYPGTEFIATDFYLELQPEPSCHVVWDLCNEHPPSELTTFGSVICQATLEHVVDPIQVMRNLSAVLSDGGFLYIQTHTPAYFYHPYPRDYLRYQPDWFEDVVKIVQSLTLIELLCVDGHAFAIYRRLPKKP